MTLPTPLYYLGSNPKTSTFWTQREYIARDKRWKYQRMWTDEQVVEMVVGMKGGVANCDCPGCEAGNDLISQLRGGR